MDEAPTTAVDDRVCDLSTTCANCGERMDPVHGHYQCAECGWRDSCCF